jgi:hypothetical protein
MSRLGRNVRIIEEPFDPTVDPIERAERLAKPHLDRPGLIGVYLCGSSLRPYRDAMSDLDIRLVVEDAEYERLDRDDRHVMVINRGPPRRKDHDLYFLPERTLQAFVSEGQDENHFTFQHARILHDTGYRLSTLRDAIARLPPEVREARRRIHFHQIVHRRSKAIGCLERGNAVAARLLIFDAIDSIVKLLFVEQESWPCGRPWVPQELALLGTPPELLEGLAALCGDPTPDRLERCSLDVSSWLTARGCSFHSSPEALARWVFLDEEGARALRRWAP